MACSKEAEIIFVEIKKGLRQFERLMDEIVPILRIAENSIILNWLWPGGAKGLLGVAEKTKKTLGDLEQKRCGGP